MTTTLPSGTVTCLDKLDDRATPCYIIRDLPGWLEDLRQSWIDADNLMQSVADQLDDGQPSTDEKVAKFEAARDNLAAARVKFFAEYDSWTAVPAGDHVEWLRMEGFIR